MGISRGNWADLPIEILDNEMVTKLGDVEDFIRFGAVSRSWRCASTDSKKTNKGYVPWLMLAESEQEHEEEGPNNKDVRKFFNLSSKKIIELYLPEAQGRRCLGSTSGWILTFGLDLNIHLLNPLTRLQIPLPPQSTFKKQFQYTNGYAYDEPATHHMRRIFVDKFALSSHPNTNHHDGGGSLSATVMVVGGPDRSLSMARPGDTAWTDVECTRISFDDVIFFNNLFYAVQHGGYVVVCDITTNPVPVATDFMPSPFPVAPSINYYLVEMSGHLHMVVRKYKIARDDNGYGSLSTLQFRVYKLNLPEKQWIELQNLGDYTLFLGNNPSFAINHPHLRSNCIYFTDDHSENYKWYDTRDMGVFDFGEKKIVPGGNNIVDFTDSIDFIQSTFCTPLYFIPNLH